MMQAALTRNTTRIVRGRNSSLGDISSFLQIRCFAFSEAVEEHSITASEDALVQEELASIMTPYYEAQKPVVVRGAVSSAPSTKLWKSWDYWHEVLERDDGFDTSVAVEIGGSYGSEQSERAEIPFVGYLQYLKLFEEQHGNTGNAERHAEPDNQQTSSWDIPSKDLVYMAQNDLPQPLYKDIFIPDFCQSADEGKSNESATINSSPSLGLGHLYSVMLWLGPRGCVSPLHYDPLDNCLMQHMGRKRVLLFEPSSASVGWHYAGHEGQQTNTSPINPEVLDDEGSAEAAKLKEKFPLFFEDGRPPRLECMLDAGDLLFIPSKWWHHVRSIDTAASVNVWWR